MDARIELAHAISPRHLAWKIGGIPWHVSMLLYALLYLTGGGLDLERNVRL
jgi:hypothetical protein